MESDLLDDLDLALAALRRVIVRAIEAGAAKPQPIKPLPSAAVAAARSAKEAAQAAIMRAAALARPLRAPPALSAQKRADCPPPVEANGVTVDFAAGPAGTVSYAGRSVNVSRRQAQAAAVLARDMPHVVSRADIASRAWPDLAVSSGQTTLSQIHEPLAARLASIGLVLKDLRKSGFALMPADHAKGIS